MDKELQATDNQLCPKKTKPVIANEEYPKGRAKTIVDKIAIDIFTCKSDFILLSLVLIDMQLYNITYVTCLRAC